MTEASKILVVDDEESIRGILQELLQTEGLGVATAASAEQALKVLKTEAIDLVLTDINMPGLNGMELLTIIRTLKIECEVVIMTSQASLETAIEAMQLGAADYLTKPFDDIQNVLTVVNRIFEKQRLRAENKRLLQDLKQKNEEWEQATQRAAMLLVESHRLFQETFSLFSCQNLDQAEQKAVEIVSQLMNGRPAVLFAHMGETNALLGRKAVGMEADVMDGLQLSFPKGSNPSDCFEKGEHISLLKTWFQDRLGSAILISPLISASGKELVLVVSKGSQGPFSPRENKLIEQFASVATLAFERAGDQVSQGPAEAKSGSAPVCNDLSGFFTLSYFLEYLIQEVTRARRYRHPFSLCLLEMGGIKGRTDKEEVLLEVGGFIHSRARISDVVARSEDRFFILLPETNKEWGGKMLESLRETLDEYCREKQPSLQGKLAIVDYPKDADSHIGLMSLLETEIHRQNTVKKSKVVKTQ